MPDLPRNWESNSATQVTPYTALTKAEKDQAAEAWKLMCRVSFKGWFCSAAKLRPKAPGAKPMTPKMNGMQQRIDEAIQWCDDHGLPARLINLKPRQGGSSSVFVGAAYHRARATNCQAAILGDDKNTTDKLLRMWKHYAENDAMSPYWGNAPKNPHQPSWLEFSHGSTLTLETANDPRAGQGATLQVLIASEVASYRSSGHSTGEDVFSSIAGCVPRLPKTLIALESTAQGMTGIFYSTYQGAVTFEQFKAGSRGNGYIKFFTPWFDFHDYTFDGQEGRQGITAWDKQQILESLDDEERGLINLFGQERITPERLAWRRQTIAGPDCGGDMDKFNREYPKDDITAFRSTSGAFFDIDGLAWQEVQITPASMDPMYGDIVLHNSRAPQFLKGVGQQGTVRIWEQPDDGESYVMSVDFCVGRQSAGSSRELDTHSVMVFRAGRLDPVTRRVSLPRLVAACREDDRSDTDIVLQRILALHRLYGDCIVVPEVNNSGNIVQQMQAIGITNIWSKPTGAGGVHGQGKTSHVLGFLTNVNTRRQILDNMARFVREQAWICSCPALLTQMKAFVRNTDGKPEAAPGYHDDHVMAAAIGLAHLDCATPYKSHRGQSDIAKRDWRSRASNCHPLGL